MTKIVNVRLPNPSAEYDAEKFNQLIRSLEQTVSENKDQAQTWFFGK